MFTLGAPFAYLALLPFTLYYFLIRSVFFSYLVGIALMATTFAVFFRFLGTDSSTGGISLAASIPNDLAIVCLAIGIERVVGHIRYYDRGGSSDGTVLHVALPIIAGATVWGVVVLASQQSPWLQPLFWMPLAVAAVGFGVAARSKDLWPVGFLLMAGAICGEIVQSALNLVEDWFFAPLYTFPYITGAFLLGFLGLASRAAWKKVTRSRRHPTAWDRHGLTR